MEFYRTDKSLVNLLRWSTWLIPLYYYYLPLILQHQHYHWYYIINIISLWIQGFLNIWFLIWIRIWILDSLGKLFEFESNLNMIDMIVLSHIHVLIHLLSVCESWFSGFWGKKSGFCWPTFKFKFLTHLDSNLKIIYILNNIQKALLWMHNS